ncbi:protein of unknown function (plasmid) [Cupriavidus taiwanensis]|uniref:Uncharacterized protein n=1 Tax=Cupriavidus taiwanensis TaxID=164546 RepID=A0A375ITU8_9BURK|nr:protein of unknown function [Cupriavidus taiwanensis]
MSRATPLRQATDAGLSPVVADQQHQGQRRGMAAGLSSSGSQDRLWDASAPPLMPHYLAPSRPLLFVRPPNVSPYAVKLQIPSRYCYCFATWVLLTPWSETADHASPKFAPVLSRIQTLAPPLALGATLGARVAVTQCKAALIANQKNPHPSALTECGQLELPMCRDEVRRRV